MNLDKKLAVYETCVPLDILILTWATPYEFWLLSTTERQKTASILVIENLPQYEWAIPPNKGIDSEWEMCALMLLYLKDIFILQIPRPGIPLIKK